VSLLILTKNRKRNSQGGWTFRRRFFGVTRQGLPLSISMYGMKKEISPRIPLFSEGMLKKFIPDVPSLLKDRQEGCPSILSNNDPFLLPSRGLKWGL
jgi:hypothetical protein